jgi:hypothetical protein
LFSFIHQKNRHFDRSSSRFCELRSGETRFSTSNLSWPMLLLLFLLLPLFLLCSFYVVILSAAKNPRISSLPSFLPLPVLLTHQTNVISTEAKRSGEIPVFRSCRCAFSSS